MSWRFVAYDAPDGSEKWAIWSTVVDAWVYYDMTEDELIEVYVERAAERARETAKEQIEDAKTGERMYHDTLPRQEAIEQLENHEID